MAYDKDREVREAIDAGEQALRSLKTAREKLNSAGNWGLLDIFGGDTISGLMKHKKIGDAERYIEALRAYLWVKSVAEMPVKPLHC